MAGIGSGVYLDAAQAIREAVSEPLEAVLPDPDRVQRYSLAYQEYIEWAQIMVDHYRPDETSQPQDMPTAH